MIALPRPSPKKGEVRIPSWKARAAGVMPDQFDLISKLFSREGMSRGEFDSLFHVCSKCNRVSRTPHGCISEAANDSELEDDLEIVLGGQ